ncbi:GntR family transcriptional regulator [Xylophilus sp. GOD-11R]|uniref:GntR family transcriptional regulator n=1 Tax=Xylophilus sp. GOD-11R TaxID=3089814 RepID=UPI00298CBF73|nr:GntR family transcriptional regulator [Xylophilus sp. GOD-11R]WPB55511.1 GntR family transcriptional regulator [Xylophilus sp. GOD-11R]
MPATEKTPAPERDFRVVRVAAPLRQSVVEGIRAAIASGHFAAGERLTEKELCEMIGVSRTLVREALRQLESEGLIDVVPNRGPAVARVSVAQAEQIYQVRRELEGLAAELFALNATEDQQKELKKALKDLKAGIGSDDPIARVASKNEFYAVLLRGSGNESLAQVLGLLNTRVTLLRATSLQHKGRAQKSLVELTTLVEALVARDAAKARDTARLHVSNAAEAALNVLREQPEKH